MKKFTLAIEETIVQKFEVLANDADEAMEIAVEKYNTGEFVLDHTEVHHKQIAVTKPKNEASEWMEF